MTVLAQFEIKPFEHRANRFRWHGADGFARQHFIVRPHGHAAESGQHQIVASGYLQDQDLSRLMVRAGEKNLAVGRARSPGRRRGWHR